MLSRRVSGLGTFVLLLAKAMLVDAATLRLVPRVPFSIAVVSFPDVGNATRAVCEALNRGAIVRQSFIYICAPLVRANILPCTRMCRIGRRPGHEGHESVWKVPSQMART